MVTHDLGVIADMCDEIIVMYGGSVCERGTADDIFYRPRHEYTKGLLRSIPNVDRHRANSLIPIPRYADQPFKYAKGLCILPALRGSDEDLYRRSSRRRCTCLTAHFASLLAERKGSHGGRNRRQTVSE